MKNNEFVTQWVIDTVKRDYADDIALVISHTTLRINDEETAMSYFVPITERGAQMGRTFILDGEGFDIWGIDWNRLEKFAELEEYNITCLADGEILYARTEEDARRFEELKQKQAQNLADVKIMRRCALQAYEQAKDIFLEMLLAQGGDVRMCAGYVIDYLAQAVAFSNLRYFKKAQVDQIRELSEMEKVPERFLALYRELIEKPDDRVQKELCYEAVRLVQAFLQEQGEPDNTDENKNSDFQMLADWYAELSYTWLRIRHYAALNDRQKTYMWGIMLQHELNGVCEDYGLERMDLMKRYDPEHLADFAAYSNQLEENIKAIIAQGGGKVRTYANAEELLHEV